jgi:general secretion pathway protein K
VIVIWGLGIIALLVVSFMTTARLRMQASNNIAGAAQADELAQAAINLGIMSLSNERQVAQQPPQQTPGTLPVPSGPPQRVIHGGEPRVCGIAGAVLAVVIEDEGGKVDINGASQALIKAMLMGFGVGMSDADMAANAIVAFRTAPGSVAQAPNLGPGINPRTKQALFQTVFELDQVEGLEPSLVRDILPFVTVHSRRPRVDAETSSPALFAALAGYKPADVYALRMEPFPNALDRADPRFPAAFKQNGDSGVFLVHAEARISTGQMSVREAIVDLNQETGSLFAIRELRRGAARYTDQLRSAQYQGLPDC